MSDFIYDRFDPLVKAGEEIAIDVSQELHDGLESRLQTVEPNSVKVKIDGPQLQLTSADIVGVYPAPGSEESPDEFLPHIALKRRTLPWERVGPTTQPEEKIPWLALLLFKESDLKRAPVRVQGQVSQAPKSSLETTQVSQINQIDPGTYTWLTQTLNLPASTSLNVLYVQNKVLQSVMPKKDELPYLCHAKRKEEIVRDEDTEDEDTEKEKVITADTAIVICNRLPDAGSPESSPEIHTAVLISLEKRDDLYQHDNEPLHGFPAHGVTALVVLHHWTFKPNQGGDFEEVIQAIGYRPNGGVLRFGNLPKEPAQGQAASLSGGFPSLLNSYGFFLDPLPHTQSGKVVYRGPLRPFPPRAEPRLAFAIRAAPQEFEEAGPDESLDYSHAAAFELGRLLAFADTGVLEDIGEVDAYSDPMDTEIRAVNKLPVALQKRDWVTNPNPVRPVRWQKENTILIKNQNELLGKGEGDPTGIREQVAEWSESVLQELSQMGIQEEGAGVSSMDINSVTKEDLTKKFFDLKNAARS